MKERFCSKCGNHNIEGALYCSSCGSALSIDKAHDLDKIQGKVEITDENIPSQQSPSQSVIDKEKIETSPHNLSMDEITVLEQIYLGIRRSRNPTIDIANELNISISKARIMQETLCEKLGVVNNRELVENAIDQGFIKDVFDTQKYQAELSKSSISTAISRTNEFYGFNIPQRFKVLTHLLSIIPVSILITIYGLSENAVATYVTFSVFLLSMCYLLIIYAIAGGFDWKLEKVTFGRGFLFFFLTGLVFGIFLYGFWIALRWAMSKIYGIPYGAVKGKLLSR